MRKMVAVFEGVLHDDFAGSDEQESDIEGVKVQIYLPGAFLDELAFFDRQQDLGQVEDPYR